MLRRSACARIQRDLRVAQSLGRGGKLSREKAGAKGILRPHRDRRPPAVLGEEPDLQTSVLVLVAAVGRTESTRFRRECQNTVDPSNREVGFEPGKQRRVRTEIEIRPRVSHAETQGPVRIETRIGHVDEPGGSGLCKGGYAARSDSDPTR